MLLVGIVTLMSLAQPLAEPVFVSGSLVPGEPYQTYRIPAICRSNKGTLLAFCEGRASVSDQAANAIVLRRRPASRRIWTDVRTIYQDSPASLNNPCVLATRNGRIWMMIQKYPHGISERNATTGYDPAMTCSSYVCHSDDDGFTWSKLTDLTAVVRPGTIRTVASGPGVGIELERGLHRGRLVFPFNQGDRGEWTAFTVYSDDAGRSWRRGSPAPKAPGTQPNEVQVAELSDGRILLNARNQAKDRCRLLGISQDAGETWSTVEEEPLLPDPICMGSLVRLSYRPNLLAFSNPSSTAAREKGLLYLSRDDGKTWKVATSIDDGSFAYSCLVPLPRRKVGVLYESVSTIADGQEGYRLLYREIDVR